MPTKKKPTDLKEARRMQAHALHIEGIPQVAIAKRLGVTEGAVYFFTALGMKVSPLAVR